MNLNKRFSFLLLSLGFFLTFTLNIGSLVAAEKAPLPFLEDKRGSEIESKDIGDSANTFMNVLNENSSTIVVAMNSLFAIMFLIGVIQICYALVTKTGMVLKGSTGILIGVPIFVITIKGFSALLFTTDLSDVTLLVSIESVLSHIGLFASVAMVLFGLELRKLFVYLTHLEYERWSKRLYIGSGIMIILTFIMPTVFQSI